MDARPLATAAPVLGGVDTAAAEAWVRAKVALTGPFELVKERPWATVLRVPTTAGGAFLKACRPVQAFEPALSAALSARWPDRVGEVLANDAERGWLLTADAGLPLGEAGDQRERWLEILPRYAELQRGEMRHVGEHLANGVPDLTTTTLPARLEALLAADLPLEAEETAELARLARRLTPLAADLAAAGIDDTIEHADLHPRSVFLGGAGLRILDWGDASVAHPFLTLVVTLGWLRDEGRLRADDPWFARLRDAYLEPFGPGHVALFELAQRVGVVVRALTWLRHWQAMGVGAWDVFDELFPGVLRRAAAALREP